MKSPKILTIEDELFQRDLIVKALHMANYQDIFQASTGKEGIRVFKKEKPDIVLLDLKLPDMHGRDVLKVLAKNKKINPKCKIIIVSTVNQEEMGQESQLTLDKARELGADVWVYKPIVAGEIIAEIKKCLNN